MINKIIIGVLVGLVIGLVAGVLIEIAVYPSTHSGAGTNNQVKVSGTISETGAVKIAFVNLAGNISSTVPITNGVYSVTIVGGQTYAVAIVDQSGNSLYTGTLYVPSGVTTFHADF
jgi:hypothetical protein